MFIQHFQVIRIHPVIGTGEKDGFPENPALPDMYIHLGQKIHADKDVAGPVVTDLHRVLFEADSSKVDFQGVMLEGHRLELHVFPGSEFLLVRFPFFL